MRVKEESEKAGLKISIQKTKIMASSPITSWQIEGEKVKTVTFYFLGLQNHCWLWLQPWNSKTLAPEKKKTMTSLDSILKIRDITLLTKVCVVKVLVFPVVMYGCESWTIKKAEHQIMDALELWCWRRLLRVFWTARKSNQSIIKEISPEYSLEGLMLKLKLQYFGYLMQELTHWKTPRCWERLRAGEEGNRGWDSWMT